MLIFALDDEPSPLETLRDAIHEALPEAQIADFRRGQEALDAIRTRGLCPDVVFTDIRMPDLDGLNLATAIKAVSPDARIVFVTAYSQYALEAWRRHVHGYLMKPVTAEDVREAMAHLPGLPSALPDRLTVRCFGHFEVSYRGKPVIFERRQSKELFAFLIDREGAPCSAEEIAAALWENETDMQAARTRIRKILSDLKATLHAIGFNDVLIRERRQLAIRPDLIDCDYYRMKEGDMDALNAYRGNYMVDFSWAELTNARLYFRKQMT